MRRVALISCLLALVAAAPAEARSLQRVKLTECREAAATAATFTGEMRAVSGTRRMAMRFILLERMGTPVFGRVDVPGLLVWHRSAAGKRRFVFQQRVENLDEAASYRVLVEFRWYRRDGTRLRRVWRSSPVCGPTVPLPNLRINSLTARAGTSPGTSIYKVEVANTGGSDATKTDLVLRVDGSAVDAARIERLGPGETRTFEFSGPVCRTRARALVDPQNKLVESSEADNTATLSCPAF